MTGQEFKKLNMPDTPGVYFFKTKPTPENSQGSILYIGRATSLRDRVGSYFKDDLIHTRGALLVDMVTLADTIEWQETDSVLESLILEANLIKEHQPKYNTKEKDNKSFNFVVITDEDYPRILTIRERAIDKASTEMIDAPIYKKFGPYPHGAALREGLKIIRKIFPYRETCKIGQHRACFNTQLGLCPGVCVGRISKEEYRKTIWRIAMFLEGRKYDLVKKLEREMTDLAKEQKFEEANKVKRILFALSHIQDIALIRSDLEEEIFDSTNDPSSQGFRIEAYDVAHTSGKQIVGVMVASINGVAQKSQYRKFKLRTVEQAHEVNSLKEILKRRLEHIEWPMPQLIVVDGNEVQRKAALSAIEAMGYSIPVVSVVKDERHRPKDILGDVQSLKEKTKIDLETAILLINGEAHRFAIAYHRRLRGKIQFK